MSFESIPGGRPVVLTLPCNPPSAASSVYAESEASADTATSLPSYASNSTIGDFYYQDSLPEGQTSSSYPYVPRDSTNTLPANPLTATPLPLLQLENGDTLLFLSPPPSAVSPELASRRAGPTSPPLRVIASNLLSSGSAVFKQLLEPRMQERIINRLLKQKKIYLLHGKLPEGIRFVLDLTPEDEGERAVEWQEKLWCPDPVLKWKSTLEQLAPLPPLGSEEDMARKLDEFRQTAWGDKAPESEKPLSPSTTRFSSKPALPEPYTFGRHILGLERLIHILHGIDPVIQSSVDWYTLHCLSVAFGTTDITRDYIARWIFSNTLMIETHPAFIWKVSVEAGLATIASDAFAAAVMKCSFSTEDAEQIPGALDAGISLTTRAQKEFKLLYSLDWVEQYLPPNPSLESTTANEFNNLKASLRGYIERRLDIATDMSEIQKTDHYFQNKAFHRNFWLSLQNTKLCGENTSYLPSEYDKISTAEIQKAIKSWKNWEEATDEVGSETRDLWKDVKLGAPHHPVPSITQQTSTDGALIPNEDARSEIISDSGTEVIYNPTDDDTKSISSTHTLNLAMRSLDTESTNKVIQVEMAQDPTTSTLVSDPIDISTTAHPVMEVQDPKEYQSETLGMFTFERQDSEESTETNKAGSVGLPTLIDDDTATVKELEEEKPIMRNMPASHPSAPLWLSQQLSDLSAENSPAYFWALMHHPSGDSSKVPEPRIRCYDCPDMLYFAGPGESLDNFRIHLRNIRHLNRVEVRRATEESLSKQGGTLTPGDTLFWSRDPDNTKGQAPLQNSSLFGKYYDADPWTQPYTPPISCIIPNGLLTILRVCETYIQTKCREMAARNIVFEPILLEENLACLEETERRFMPLWSGGEEVPSTGRNSGVANRGVSDSSPGDDMTFNVSTTGVGSVCTASTFASTESFSAVEIPTGSTSSGSVISLPEEISYEDDIEMSATGSDGDDDDWDMAEDDETFDDAYFT